MIRLTSIVLTLIVGFSLWFLVLQRANKSEGEAQSVVSSSIKKGEAVANSSLEDVSPVAVKRPEVPSEPVTLEEIALISESSESAIVFRRLSIELVDELVQLENEQDAERIKSRLTTTVQKFYYLQRAIGLGGGKALQRLPSSFKSDIETLERIWTENSVLARTADDLFTSHDLLLYEHVPYQLRQELVMQ